ncbi:hypothetical protein [Herbidospora mongoliensis]|uniref:hypothetical protein n=1 Tax=Herbidospora mongoliensis TaxID=688067 RepID=UPI000A82B203|nr:hypothetical protein [Herbidospora mongoliensis]
MLLLLAVTLVVTAGSVEIGSPSQRDRPSASAGSESTRFQFLWEQRIQAVEQPVAADRAIVFHALGENGQLQVVSLDPATGEILWTSPASPSEVAPERGVRVLTLEKPSLVVWMQPGDYMPSGDVALVAADAWTGKIIWRFGNRWLRVTAPPATCHENRVICLTGSLAGPRYGMIMIDAATGRMLLSNTSDDRKSVREIAERLRDSGTALERLNEDGSVRWSRPYAALFGERQVSPEQGWTFALHHGTYVGSFGMVRPLSTSDRGRVSRSLDDRFVTAGIDADTGRTLWTKSGMSVICGDLEFDVDHPVRCRQQGKAVWVEGRLADLVRPSVILEGFDLVSGHATWRWRLGAVAGLMFVSGKATGDYRDVLRIDRTKYAIESGDQRFLLDMDKGPLVDSPPEVGWCRIESEVNLLFQIRALDTSMYTKRNWYPCTSSGLEKRTPSSAPAFAGARTSGVFVWLGRDGSVRAARST